MLFCLDSIKAQLRLGGTSPVLRKDKKGIDRSCIYIDNISNEGLFRGQVIGLQHLLNSQPFDYGCFSESCFIGSGIWSIARNQEIIDYLSFNKVNESCFGDCVEDFNPVCRIDLPDNYSFPHLSDSKGKYLLIDVNEDYCSDDFNELRQEIDPSPFVLGEYLEGTMMLHTYTKDGITLALIKEGCTFVYLLVDESECFESCALSRLRLVAVYQDLELSTDDDFVYTADAPQDLIDAAVKKHEEILNFKYDYLTKHKCLKYCNSKSISVNGVEIRFNNSNEVWIEGLSDGEYVYTVDIGIIHPFSNEVLIFDRYVPLSSKAWFSSRKAIPDGRKVVILKRTNRYRSDTILHYIEGEQEVIKTKPGHLHGFNAIDQAIDVEDLSITLINLLLSKYSYRNNCDSISELRTLDPEILNICKTSIDFLSSLISKENDITKGSIPAVVASYSTYESIYRNPRYSNPFIQAFEEGSLSDECYEVEEDKSLISKDIDNKALCWFVYALCTYIEVTSDRSYIIYLNEVLSYLDTQTNSISLLKEGIKNGSVIEEYLFSTSSIYVLSLMRCHDISSNTSYLDRAADTYLSIDKYLLLPNNTYSHSYEHIEASSDSLIYSLIYSIYLNKEDIKESILSILKVRAKSGSNYKHPLKIVSRDGIQIGPLFTRSYTEEVSIGNKESISPIHLSSDEFIPLKYLVLLDSSYKHIGLSNTVDRVKSLIDSQVTRRDQVSTVLLSYCLTEKVIGNELHTSNSLYDLEHLLFQRRFIIEKLLKLIPKDYTWFDESALSTDGVLGSFLYIFSLSLSNWYVGMRRFSNGFSLSKAKDSHLYRWGRDFSIDRKIQEPQSEYSQRIKDYSNSIGITKDLVEIAASNQGLFISISESEILGIEGIDYLPYNSQREQKIQGFDINPSTIYIESKQPLNKDSIDFINNLLPIGVRALYTENIQYVLCEPNNNAEYVQVREDTFSFTYDFICCPRPSTCLPIYVSVDLANAYSIPVYVYSEFIGEEDLPILSIDTVHRHTNLIGLFKAGETSKTLRIERLGY